MGKKKNYIFGAMILAAGGILAKFLGIFYKVPLDSIIGKEGLGLAASVYPIYTTFLSISIIGLPVAVSKMVSERMLFNNYKGALQVFRVALKTLAAMGFTASLIMFVGANQLIVWFDWNPDVYYSIIALSLAPFLVAIASAYKGFFQGMQSMGFSSVSQVIEQIARVGIGVWLAYTLNRSFGLAMGAAGATFGATCGALISLIFLSFSFGRYKKKRLALLEDKTYTAESNRRIIKTLFLLALPIAAGSITNTLMDLINSVTVYSSLSQIGMTKKEITVLFGILESNVQTLVNVPLIIGSALAASLVPTISESFLKKDHDKMVQKATIAIRSVFFISVPAAIGLSVLAEPILNLLFRKSPDGGDMLSYLAFAVISITAMTTLQGILQGAGRFYKPLKNLLIGACIKLALNLTLVPNPSIGIFGAIYSSLIATFVVFILNYRDVKKFIGVGPIASGLIKTVITSVLMGMFAKFSFPWFSSVFGAKIGVLVCIFVCAAFYIGTNYLIKTISREELRQIRG